MFWVGLLSVAAIAVVGTNLFNRLVRLHYRMKSALARTEKHIQRRHELVPNLVENAKAYMTHDRNLLDAVIGARQQAVLARESVGDNHLDAAGLERLCLAEIALQTSVRKLTQTMEKYPDLQANEVIHTVLRELATENSQIASAQQHFNETVLIYNTGLEVFPSKWLAVAFRFKPASLCTVETNPA
jgi:LemA protein